MIRGGYSIFYSGSSYPQIASRMAAQPPFAVTGNLSSSISDPLTLQNGFPTQPSSTVTNTYGVDKNYRLAYAQTWTIAVQQTLPHNLVLELEYIGTKGTGLDVVENPNQTPPGSPARRPQNVANANAFTYETDHANSIFHAGQVRVTRRFSRGMSAVALYTFSKSIDNASSFHGRRRRHAGAESAGSAAERGLSSSDQRHRLSLTYMLSSPVGIHGLWRNGGWKTRLFTGWTLSGTFTANSGSPLTAYISGNLAGTTRGNAISGNFRAEATGENIFGGDFPYFNANAFAAPPAGQYGNAGRNTIPGPTVTSLNGALNRAWRFGETRRQLQLRISANNVLNHVEITGFGTTVNSATYGLPTAASGTRTVTLQSSFRILTMRTIWILTLLALSAAGQQQQTPAPAPGLPVKATFSASSNLVIVDVTVKDKSGKAIDGLTENDFTVLEDGKPQKIQVFEHQKLSLEPEPPRASAFPRRPERAARAAQDHHHGGTPRQDSVSRQAPDGAVLRLLEHGHSGAACARRKPR